MRAQSRRMALCGVLCALAEVFLLLGGLIPAALYACPILAMLSLLPVREECGPRFALVSWAAVAILALLLCPDKELAGVYLALGWYPPLQSRFDALRPKLLSLLSKLAAFLLCTGALYAALIWLFQLESVVPGNGGGNARPASRPAPGRQRHLSPAGRPPPALRRPLAAEAPAALAPGMRIAPLILFLDKNL